MTRSLDTWIIETIFEPISHRVEAWTGVNNFTLSRFALTGWLAKAGVDVIQKQSALHYWLLALAIFVCIMCAGNANHAEKMAKRLGTADPTRHHPVSVYFRNFWLALVAMDAVISTYAGGWHTVLGSIGYGAHMYFLCCSPMPPNYRQELELRSVRPTMATVE